MGNISKKLLLIIGLLIASLLIFLIWSSPKNESVATSSPTPLSQQVNESEVIITEIDFGGSSPVEITLEESEHTAFSALQKAAEIMNYDLVTEQFDFGIFVKSVNGYESDTQKAWLYFVNGQSGDIAADQKQLQPGDTVSWRYADISTE